jgi:MinD superfamily P-loop ATPase
MRVTVASGKGGVGKSMIASIMVCLFAQDRDVVAIDCDVDAPNLSLWLGIDNESDTNTLEARQISTTEKPVIDKDSCIGCGICVNRCGFGALRLNEGKAELIPHRCEGCGLCEIVCPQKAIHLEPVDNVTLAVYGTDFGFPLVQGQIAPGEAESGEAVTELRKISKTYGGADTVYLQDAAAGIGCPVIASVVGSDYMIIVAEPTKSSISDMKRMIELVGQFSIPYGVVINKHDLNPEMTEEIETLAGKTLLGKISYDRKIVEELVGMRPVIKSGLPVVDEVRGVYEKVCERAR